MGPGYGLLTILLKVMPSTASTLLIFVGPKILLHHG